MMFDTLVCGLSDDHADDDEGFEIFRGSKSVCDEILKKTSYFDSYTPAEGEKEDKDPILQYLQRYYTGPEAPDSSDVGDLSWDEGDLPQHDIKVWTFNDFMGQYNQLYAFLNTIQVAYHSAKKASGSCPRVESLLKDLERDVERRERFLRECGRMVGEFPELEEEVSWRVEHVIAKWDMLSQLRVKARTAEADVPDIYSDIELEVRCLRRWLREMEARIDPLQFGTIQLWSAGDREKKMAEYQVLQTDIESHGRIVKLVLGLCEELSQDPGLYDLQHAVRVARGLERRWHHIWLRSLEWQCLLEQWIHDPTQGTHPEDSVFDTDDEPLTKVPRLTSDIGSVTASPAATLLRRKRRKRWPGTPREETGEGGNTQKREMTEQREVLTSSPKMRRRILDREQDEEAREEEHIKMQTSESEPSTGPSTARSESSESTLGYLEERIHLGGRCGFAEWDKRGERPEVMEGETIAQNWQRIPSPQTPLSTLDVIDDIIDVDESSHHGFWDTSDEEAFVENKNKLMMKVRKVTVIHAGKFVREGELEENGQDQRNMKMKEREERKLSEEGYSQDSLEPGIKWLGQTSSVEGGSESHLSSPEDTDNEIFGKVSAGEVTASLEEAGQDQLGKLLHFGDDYRKYIDSLSDSSTSLQRTRGSKKVKKRSTRRREGLHDFPYESQSEAELEEACVALSFSQVAMEEVERAATAFFSHPGDSGDTQTYDNILSRCSHNVNLLFHLLESVTKGESFAKQKKCRDIRLLIARWEKLLQNVSETVNNASVYSELKEKVDSLKGGLERLEEERRGEKEEEDLDVRLQAIKAEQSLLTEWKSSLLSLSLSVHSFLADLSSSDHNDQTHLSLAESLRQQVVSLYSIWEASHQTGVARLARVEAGLEQLTQVTMQLGELRAEVNLQAGQLKARQTQWAKGEQSSEDSGWASEDCNLPGKQERLGRIKQMARSLESVLSPRSPSVQAMARSLEATDTELSQLQRTVITLKNLGHRRRKRSNRGGMTANHSLGLRQDRDRFRPRARSRSPGGLGRRKVVKCCLGVHLLLLLVLFLSWLCQPTCCDSFSAISAFSPQLKYVNGPPPI